MSQPIPDVEKPTQQVEGTPLDGVATGTVIHAAVPNYSGPVQTYFVPPPATNPWSTGLFQCFEDMSSCCDTMWCGYCQMSRQYNVLTYGRREVEPITCFLPYLANAMTGTNIGTAFLAWHLRQRIRMRYGIVGTDLEDFLSAFFCTPCTVCQNYREMSVRNEWPGGCFLKVPFNKLHQPIPQEMGEQTPSVEN